jgi:hypothetical protein
MFVCMSVRPKFVAMEAKVFVNPEDHVYELLCISKLETSLLDHLAPILFNFELE